MFKVLMMIMTAMQMTITMILFEIMSIMRDVADMPVDEVETDEDVRTH